MNIWNNRFKSNGWETTKMYARAIKNDFFVEALVFSVNMLKAIMFVVLEREYLKRGVSQDKINKRLLKNKDVGELLNLARDIKIFSKIEDDKLRAYWNLRNRTIHAFVDGEVDYQEVSDLVKRFGDVYEIVQGKLIKIKIKEIG